MGLFGSLLGQARPASVVASESAGSICAPASGKVVSLSEVKDPVFSQGMLGEGAAIRPAGNVAYAPVSGVVTAVVGSKHAVAISGDSGAQVLLHVGVDTVCLKGRGFTTFVEKGDRVRAGEAVICFDSDVIRSCGLDDTVIVTVTNSDEMGLVEPACDQAVSAGEPLLRTADAA